MIANVMKVVTSLALVGLLAANTGCACKSVDGAVATKTDCDLRTTTVAGVGHDLELPRNAKSGECYAKVWQPPEFESKIERVMVRAESERLEIIPAEYEWVEERVCIKEASKRLIEEPAQFETREVTVRTASAHTDWVMIDGELCEIPTERNSKAGQDVFCRVNYPELKETRSVECMVKPPCVREEIIPAEYETVRLQKLVKPASTKTIRIPAEFENVEKTQKVCDGRFVWQRVECEKPAIQTALLDVTRIAPLPESYQSDYERQYEPNNERD